MRFEELTGGRTKKRVAGRIVLGSVRFSFDDHSADAIPVQMRPDHISGDIQMVPVKEFNVQSSLRRRHHITAPVPSALRIRSRPEFPVAGRSANTRTETRTTAPGTTANTAT